MKKKKGRSQVSARRSKIPNTDKEVDEQAEHRKIGRPKGSKNRPKSPSPDDDDDEDEVQEMAVDQDNMKSTVMNVDSANIRSTEP